MSLEKKLQKKYTEGLLAGYQDTWGFFEEAMKQVPGIGDKRRKAILDKVNELARQRFRQEVTMGNGYHVRQTTQGHVDRPERAYPGTQRLLRQATTAAGHPAQGQTESPGRSTHRAGS